MKPKFSNLLFFFVLIILYSCNSSKESDESKNESQAPLTLQTVLTGEVKNMQFQGNITLAGIAQPNQEVVIYAMSNGFVKAWKYDIGDAVKKGETLAVLENPELMEEKLKAQADMEGMKAISDRLNDVYKKTPELVPLEQVDEANAKYESAKAQLDVVNSEIQYLTVTSPFNGIITNRYVDTGAVVQDALSRPGSEPLFKVQDISVIRVNVSIPEVNSPDVSTGTPVNVVFPDLSNSAFSGKVSRISYGLSEETKTMLIQIDINNKENKIHPGMYAIATFRISSPDSALSIPNTAISTDEQESFVLKAIPLDSGKGPLNWESGVKCRLQKVRIKIGMQEAVRSEILNSGLKENDMVVVSGKNQSGDGMIVLAKEK